MKINLTIADKCKILNELDYGEKVKDICAHYNVNQTTIYRIKNLKERILKFAFSSHVKQEKRKRMRNLSYLKVDQALYAWFINERLNKNIITNEILRIKELEFHSILDSNTQFQGSSDFIEKFKRRHGIRLWRTITN